MQAALAPLGTAFRWARVGASVAEGGHGVMSWLCRGPRHDRAGGFF